MEEEMLNSKFQIQRLSDIPEADIPKTLEEVVKVEKEAWPEEIQAPLEKFQARAEVFPQGFLLISLPDLGLVGVSTAEIINYDPLHPPISWEETTDNGWIRSTHNPEGNALYLISVGASPRSAGRGVGTRLVQEQLDLARRLNLDYLVLGSRIPKYHEYHLRHPEMTIDQYLLLTRSGGEVLDPEIRFYTRCGLKVIRVVPDYMEDDPESENYGAVMVWENRT
ncbi:GNAT family N-acetyltransferase [Candidatus Daviesbacteria bacterium]|nr:GNAT family N-acetyltransferase [Candidatus Daviesbacteria bacterium]